MGKKLQTLLLGALLNLGTFESEAGVKAAPKYNIPDNHCAQYARQAAKDLFGKIYPRADAWNMRYDSKIVARSEKGISEEKLSKLAEAGVLKPGMILGVYNPRSTYNGHTDKTGNKLEYSHVVIYTGSENGTNYIAQQLGKNQITKEPLRNISVRGHKVEEILDVK
ncbi:hypothetical protein KA107_03680 [Candidatus Pacearchaeota archaeon]|nr:hypothetical protein [Candidatus Pacearchaeota archaeon]